MIQALLIEDEKPAIRRLQRMLEKEHIQVLQVLTSIQSAVAWLQSNKHPQLIFCDIQLSDGLAFEIFDQVNVLSPIIFTTAFNQYAVRAFKLNGIDYLLKPFSQDDLKGAISRFNKQNNHLKIADFTEIYKNLQEKKVFKERFVVKNGVYIHVINSSDINYFYSENKATFLYAQSGKEFIVDESLEKLIRILNPKKFFRINRQYIISLNAVAEMIQIANSRIKIILNNKQETIVARDRVKDFLNWLE